MIRHVSWIMGVAVIEFWHHFLKRVKHIQVRSRIQICRSNRRSSVGNEEKTQPTVRPKVFKIFTNDIGDVNNFSLAMSFKGKDMLMIFHTIIIL